MAFCAKCGAANPESANFCHECGEPAFGATGPKTKIPRLLVASNLLLAIAIQCGLLFVVPVFAAMFDDFGAKLPVLTRLLLRASELWKAWWWGINSTFGFAAILSFLRLAKSAELRWWLVLVLILQSLLLMAMFIALALPIVQLGQVAGDVR